MPRGSLRRIVTSLALVCFVILMLLPPAAVLAAPPQQDAANTYAELLAPVSGDKISGAIVIYGVASALEFDHYDLYIAPAGTLQSQKIASGTRAVTRRGILAAWDSRSVPNGQYDLHLLVVKANKTYAASSVRGLIVANTVPAGAYPQATPVVQAKPVVRATAAVRAPAPPKPNPGIAAPQAGALVRGTVNIKGTALTPGFMRYEVYVAPHDSQNWSFLSMSGTQVTAETLAAWETASLPDGSYDLRLRVVRLDANYDEYIVSGVTVRNQAAARAVLPVVTSQPRAAAGTSGPAALTAPAAGARIRNTVTIVGTANGASYQRYELYISPSGTDGWSWVMTGSSPVTAGTLGTWDTSVVPDGRYDVRLRVVRLDGNYSETFIRNLLVDNNPGIGPQATETAVALATKLPDMWSGFTAPVAGARVAGTVTLRGSATAEAFTRYELAVAPAGTTNWGYLSGNDRPVSQAELGRWDTLRYPDGEYDIRLRVVHPDGNYKEYYLHNLSVRNRAMPGATATPTRTPVPRANSPVVVPTPSLAQSGLSAPIAGSTLGGRVTVRGTASDANFLRYELYVRPANANQAWSFVYAGYEQIYEAALGQWDSAQLADGRYDLRLRVVRRDANYDDYMVQGLVVKNGNATPVPSSTPTPTAPPLAVARPTAAARNTPAAVAVAAINSPRSGSTVRGVVAITGQANSPHFVRYELYVTPAGKDQWVFLSLGGSAQAAPGELGRWDTTALANGRYDLRLRVVTPDGNYQEVAANDLTVANLAAKQAAAPPRPSTAQVTPRPSTAQVTPGPAAAAPVANVAIGQPREKTSVSNTVVIGGSATNPQFVRYELWVAATTFPNAQNWQLIHTSSQPVTNGVLGSWDTWSVQDGLYDIRLRVVKYDGNYDEAIVRQLLVENH